MALRTVIIGGSNTVMQPGYMPTLLSALARRGIRIDVVADLAVGGTTSAFGLFQLKTHDVLSQCDLLIIEYALNDAFVYGDERRPFRHWARLYEGIIRFALERNPKLRIISLVFGARNGSFLASVPSIDAGIHYISEWYGASVINVSRALVQRYGREIVTHPSFYSDQGHYARPIATTIVAELIAEELEVSLQTPHCVRSLPPPIDPHHFAAASILDVGMLSKVSGISAGEYKNRRFTVGAADLGRTSLRLEIDNGRLLALAYVCEPRIAPLEISLADGGFRCGLLKAGVRDGAFKFLISMLSCEFLYGTALLQELPRFACRIAAANGGASHKEHLPKDNVSHDPVEGATPVLPIVGLLYTGTLRSCAIDGP